MPEYFVELEVINGPDTGKVYRVRDIAVIGRVHGCDIVLNDGAVSSNHARVAVSPAPVIVDLGSVNKILHNGTETSAADLNENDVIQIGETQLRVRSLGGFKRKSDAEKDVERAANRRKRQRILMAVVGVLAAGALTYLGLDLREKTRLQTIPAKASGLSFAPKFQGWMELKFPKDEEFDEPGWKGRTTFSRWFNKAERPATVEQLRTATVLPPDPMSRGFNYINRDWRSMPPRLGSGRFLTRDRFVLGDYRGIGISFSNDILTNPTPAPFIGKFGLSEITPLNFAISVEAYDGLPADATVKFFSLDAAGSEREFATRPLVPRQHAFLVDRKRWDSAKSNEEQQYATAESVIEGTPYQRFRVRQYKKGETLYILRATSFAWQDDRVHAIIESIMDAQVLPGRTRDKEDFLANAKALEESADVLVPDVLAMTKNDFDVFPEKEKLFQAFFRYKESLVKMQLAGRWRNDETFDRRFDKAKKLYDYIHDETGYFRKAYRDIEENLRFAEKSTDKRRQEYLNESLKKVEALWKVTLAGQEPATYAPDEWFIYAHMRRLKLLEEKAL